MGPDAAFSDQRSFFTAEDIEEIQSL